MKKVVIYTDGGCRGNGTSASIGGYGIIMMFNNTVKEIKEARRGVTNNIMELSSVIHALGLLKEPCEVTLYSDSAYVVNAINQNWLTNWQKNGWKTSKKEPVSNKELWEELIELLKKHKVSFIKVKGHSDNVYNNKCDLLANQAMDELMRN